MRARREEPGTFWPQINQSALRGRGIAALDIALSTHLLPYYDAPRRERKNGASALVHPGTSELCLYPGGPVRLGIFASKVPLEQFELRIPWDQLLRR